MKSYNFTNKKDMIRILKYYFYIYDNIVNLKYPKISNRFFFFLLCLIFTFLIMENKRTDIDKISQSYVSSSNS